MSTTRDASMAAGFKSEIQANGWLRFPSFQGVRVMMMPFEMRDPQGSLPDSLAAWRDEVEILCELSGIERGIGYLTIDEALVRRGETHRRPGLHVDGVGPDGKVGGWGGGGGWGTEGMLVAASVCASRGWIGEFDGTPGPNGDCEHLRAQCPAEAAIYLHAGVVFYCSPLAMHEGTPVPRDTRRQFVRLSLPSDAPWYEGYTPNPLGIKPTGPIHPARSEFMAYRPGGMS